MRKLLKQFWQEEDGLGVIWKMILLAAILSAVVWLCREPLIDWVLHLTDGGGLAGI